MSVSVAVVIVVARAMEKLVSVVASMFALVMRLLLLVVVGSDMSVLVQVLGHGHGHGHGPGPVWGPKLASLAMRTKTKTGREAATATVMASAKYWIANVVMALFVVVVAAIDTKDMTGDAAPASGLPGG